MNTVIKGTKTVEEYKQVKKGMEELATRAFENHKKAFSEWKEGDIKKVWFDSDSNFCIEYDSGNWWHYRLENGEIVWW